MAKQNRERLQYTEERFRQFILNNLKPHRTFVDVGSNLGEYTLLAKDIVNYDQGG